MAQIDIDIRTVRNENYALPGLASKIGNSRKELSLLRWRLPENILEQREVKQRIEYICRDLSDVENQIERINKVTNDSISRYTVVENTISKRNNDLM